VPLEGPANLSSGYPRLRYQATDGAGAIGADNSTLALARSTFANNTGASDLFVLSGRMPPVPCHRWPGWLGGALALSSGSTARLDACTIGDDQGYALPSHWAGRGDVHVPFPQRRQLCLDKLRRGGCVWWFKRENGWLRAGRGVST